MLMHKNVSNKAKAHAHLSTFGFLPTHKADTKNQKSLNFNQRKKNGKHELFNLYRKNELPARNDKKR